MINDSTLGNFSGFISVALTLNLLLCASESERWRKTLPFIDRWVSPLINSINGIKEDIKKNLEPLKHYVPQDYNKLSLQVQKKEEQLSELKLPPTKIVHISVFLVFYSATVLFCIGLGFTGAEIFMQIFRTVSFANILLLFCLPDNRLEKLNSIVNGSSLYGAILIGSIIGTYILKKPLFLPPTSLDHLYPIIDAFLSISSFPLLVVYVCFLHIRISYIKTDLVSLKLGVYMAIMRATIKSISEHPQINKV